MLLIYQKKKLKTKTNTQKIGMVSIIFLVVLVCMKVWSYEKLTVSAISVNVFLQLWRQTNN